MRSLVLLTALLCSTYVSISQETTTLLAPAERHREIGIIGETLTNSNGTDDISMVGLQYKHWKNKNFGFRGFAAYGEYNYRAGNNGIAEILGDTFVQKAPFTRVDMGIIGLGIEAQRQFYKSVHFFAAIELKGGYGAGQIDTAVTKTYAENKGIATSMTNTGAKDEANAFFVGVSPTVGAKFLFKHISFGAELVNQTLTFKGVSYKNAASFSWADFDMSRINTRVFFSYRF